MMRNLAAARRVHPGIAPLAFGAAAVGACVFVAMNDPTQQRLYVCPFREMTGLPCPGCGTTRAAFHVMRGDLGSALEFNAVAVVFLFPLMIGFYLAWALPRLGGPELVKLRMPNWLAFTLLFVVLGWWAVRLLPFEPFLALRI